ncbi:MAG: hypothetical protein PF518_15270 [Spirochaetaceae bacterium]|jgi:protein-L-isoaspartate(D-aspartate) O-methyltransferase|nr:hypothetical protein [Spirochaetaceae bacterium]
MQRTYLFLILILFSFSSHLFSQELESEEVRYFERKALVDSLFADSKGIFENLQNAFFTVRRDLFIDKNYSSLAYNNIPIPSKGGLIHPSPEMIATILKTASVKSLDKVLIIGRNTNYIAQIVSILSKNLYVIDPGITALSQMNYQLKTDFSYYGWLEEGPFDVIILFGAVEKVPQSLFSQIKVNGKMIYPFTFNKGNQILTLVSRYSNSFDIRSIGESYIHNLQ